jgi:cell division protein FtsW
MKPHQPDYILMIVAFALVIFGLVMIASAGIVMSQDNFGVSYYYFRHQLFYGVFTGLLFWIIFQKVDYHILKKLALPGFILTIILLLLVFIPGISYGYGGAERWIKIGFSIQPSEICKLTFIIYLALWLEKRGRTLTNFQTGLLPFVCLVGLVGILLILQPDVSTLGVICLTALEIYFLAGAKLSHIALLILAGMGGLAVLVKTEEYRMKRITAFLHPEIDPQGISYQIYQALMAIGSGGILGLGLGHSRQKYNYLPEPISDSIFAVLSEELGLIGALVLISLFAVFALRGFRIAKNAPDIFGKLIAGGITFWIISQAFMNIMAISGLIPLTGIPLPFISYGGSALVVSFIGVGILLNISKYTKENVIRKR